MTFEEIKQGEETYIMHTYGRFPIALDHGNGRDASTAIGVSTGYTFSIK